MMGAEHRVFSQTPAPPMTTQAITAVSLERRCFGCDREFKITLGRDGTATRTTFANPRRGVAERTATGAFPATSFADLARQLISDNFFGLADDYRDPQTADGEATVTTVAAGDRQKTVTERNGTAPPGLRRIQAAIDDLAAKVTWKPLDAKGMH